MVSLNIDDIARINVLNPAVRIKELWNIHWIFQPAELYILILSRKQLFSAITAINKIKWCNLPF